MSFTHLTSEKKAVEGITGPTQVYCGATVTYYRSTSCPCSSAPWQDPTSTWVTVVAGGGNASYITIQIADCSEFEGSHCPNDLIGSYGIELGDCGCDLACLIYYQ